MVLFNSKTHYQYVCIIIKLTDLLCSRFWLSNMNLRSRFVMISIVNAEYLYKTRVGISDMFRHPLEGKYRMNTYRSCL